MPRKFANTLLILALLIVAVVSWQWLDDRDSTAPATENSVDMAVNETDYTLEDFVITNVNNNNGQVYQLRGKLLSHFVNDNNSVIDKPSLQMTGQNRQSWTGNATTGYLSKDFSKLQLVGNVVLSHHRINNPPVNVATEKLNIDSASRQMTTTDPVRIDGGQWSFQANQMQADVDHGILQFQSGVEAQYAVQQ